jgi:hypothetical protein
VHGLQWDTSPCSPTLSHQLADNILARNGLSRKFIQVSRGVSKAEIGQTTVSPMGGAAPLRATPDFAVYPTGDGLFSPPHARVEVKGFGLSEANPLGSGVKQRLLLRPKHRNKSRPSPSAWRRSQTVCRSTCSSPNCRHQNPFGGSRTFPATSLSLRTGGFCRDTEKTVGFPFTQDQSLAGGFV